MIHIMYNINGIYNRRNDTDKSLMLSPDRYDLKIYHLIKNILILKI